MSVDLRAAAWTPPGHVGAMSLARCTCAWYAWGPHAAGAHGTFHIGSHMSGTVIMLCHALTQNDCAYPWVCSREH